MKRCGKCLETKPLTEFHKDKSRRDGVYSRCKSCCTIAKKVYRMSYPERQRGYSIKYKYGISEEEYDRLHENAKQCPICGFVGKLHLDHDHSTGVMREFVCPNCNKALGLLNEDPERMERMIAYVRKHERRIR